MTVLVQVLAVAMSWILGWLVPKDPQLLIVGGRQFGGNTKPIFESAASHGLRAFWLTTRPDILTLEHPRIISSRSWRGIWLGARAGRVAFTHALGDFSPVRFPHPAVKLFNLWHGMPLRRVSTQDPDFWARSHAKSNVREMKRYSGMFVTSPAMVTIFQQTFGLPAQKIHITGQARTDSIARGDFMPIDDLFDPQLPPDHRKILYCPTWREGVPVRLFPFPDMDLEGVQARLEALNAVMYVRTHPNDPGKWPGRDRRIVPFQGDVAPEVTDTLGNFDVLLTDYSSVFYDFLFLDRPTIFLPYDLAEYSTSPGFYRPFDEMIAGPQPTTQADFLRELDWALTSPEHAAAERRRVIALIHTHRDAGSTDRMLAVIAQTVPRPAQGTTKAAP
jgi:CDP-glycerol glycerophosphotransferase (TagB/SpsB family)